MAKPAAAAAAADVEELPKTIVRRVVKDKLSELSGDVDINIHKESILAFSESARIFIHYLSATANDICRESKRQTINAEDIFKALEEIEFPEFIGTLKASLNDFRQKNAGKKAVAAKAKAKEVAKGKKKIIEEEPPTQDEEEEVEEEVEEEEDKEEEEEAEEPNDDEDEVPDED